MNDLIIRIPAKTKLKWQKKKDIIEEILRKNKIKVTQKDLSMAKTLDFYAQKPIFIYEDEVINFFKKKRFRGVQI